MLRPFAIKAFVALALEGFVQVLVYLLQKAHRGEPALIWPHQQGEVFGHVTRPNSAYDNLLQRFGKVDERCIVI